MLKYPRMVAQCIPYCVHQFIWGPLRTHKHIANYSKEKRYLPMKRIVISLLDHMRIDWDVKGLENLQALEEAGTPFLIVSNHEGVLDALVLVYFAEKPLSVVAKIETSHYPFVREMVPSLEGYFMDRKDLRQSFNVIKGLEHQLENHGFSYMIFPEGTRNRYPMSAPLAPFHPGSFKAATLAKAPILPVSIHGTFRPLQKHPDYQRNPIEVTFFKPLYASDYEGKDTTALAVEIQAMVEKENFRQREEELDFFQKGYQTIPLKKGKLR
jgi:1-acyl-sn-glycerol-3-phosphate acyltransferase